MDTWVYNGTSLVRLSDGATITPEQPAFGLGVSPLGTSQLGG